MIFIDIDGVLTDVPATINKLFDTNIDKLYTYDFLELDIQDEIFNIFNNEHTRWAEESVPNRAFIDILLSSGAEFMCLTARHSCQDETQKWLDENVKEGIKVLYSQHKHLYLGKNDLLIDDCPKNIYNCIIEGKRVYLYMPPNHDFSQEVEYYNIKNIVTNEKLLKLLKRGFGK